MIHITKENFEEVVSNNSLVLIDFFATWCGPCKMEADVLEKLSKKELKYEIGKINVDEETDLAIKYEVQSIPTLIVLKDGVLVDKKIGYLEMDAIEDLMSKYL